MLAVDLFPGALLLLRSHLTPSLSPHRGWHLSSWNPGASHLFLGPAPRQLRCTAILSPRLPRALLLSARRSRLQPKSPLPAPGCAAPPAFRPLCRPSPGSAAPGALKSSARSSALRLLLCPSVPGSSPLSSDSVQSPRGGLVHCRVHLSRPPRSRTWESGSAVHTPRAVPSSPGWAGMEAKRLQTAEAPKSVGGMHRAGAPLWSRRACSHPRRRGRGGGGKRGKPANPLSAMESERNKREEGESYSRMRETSAG